MEPQAIKASDTGIGAKKFAEIAELGGFGRIGTDQGGLDPDSTLDLSGVLDPDNKVIDPDKVKAIKALLAGSTVREVETTLEKKGKNVGIESR